MCEAVAAGPCVVSSSFPLGVENQPLIVGPSTSVTGVGRARCLWRGPLMGLLFWTRFRDQKKVLETGCSGPSVHVRWSLTSRPCWPCHQACSGREMALEWTASHRDSAVKVKSEQKKNKVKNTWKRKGPKGLSDLGVWELYKSISPEKGRRARACV